MRRLQFGEPDFDCGLRDAVRMRVQPRPGRLVLFPSLFWHGTSPFSEQATRLTIAFDVMPPEATGHLSLAAGDLRSHAMRGGEAILVAAYQQNQRKLRRTETWFGKVVPG